MMADTPNRGRTMGRMARKLGQRSMQTAVLVMILSSPALVAGQDCISLQGSTACPAFKGASISTIQSLKDQFGFLAYVSDTKSFDDQLTGYLQTSYVQEKYQSLFGCTDVSLTNSSDLYARFTTTVMCNAIVQASKSTCKLSDEAARPVCAETCAEFAQSEAYVTSENGACASSSNGALNDLIRADFINCALPQGALASTCILGSSNESDNCGYGNSTIGLCSYCAAGGINSTDTCCYGANAEDRCKGVKLPDITSTMSFSTPVPTSTSTATSEASTNGSSSSSHRGLSGGAIAGIVIGVIAGIILIALLLFLCLRKMKSRQGSQQGSILNQPSPARRGPSMSQSRQDLPQGYEVLPGGRIARMSALEGHSGDSPTHHHGSSVAAAAAAAGVGGGYLAGKRTGTDTQSSSDDYHESPGSDARIGTLRAPPTTLARRGSLSSGEALGGSVPHSPDSAGYSSPHGLASQQSEQLPFFKDYYSQDDIHPSDRVAVLWAYQPRANDEFSLERGDMLKVVGIWDDGWATGVMVEDRAEDWELRRQAQRDSGVSNTSGRGGQSSTQDVTGEIKAFPLVCVCLPEHWKKTVDGDVSTDSGTNGYNASSS